MKKLIAFLIPLFILTGCGKNLMNTPTKKVEAFFQRYQSLDQDVLDQLNDTALYFNDEQKKKYIDIMKRHYQSLKYEIKDEVIDGNTATVTVEIEVLDYSKILEDANNYLEENKKEFETDNIYSEELFNKYRLEQLDKAYEYVTYTIDMTLTKIEGEWTLDDITKDIEDKIQGTYTKTY